MLEARVSRPPRPPSGTMARTTRGPRTPRSNVATDWTGNDTTHASLAGLIPVDNSTANAYRPATGLGDMALTFPPRDHASQAVDPREEGFDPEGLQDAIEYAKLHETPPEASPTTTRTRTRGRATHRNTPGRSVPSPIGAAARTGSSCTTAASSPSGAIRPGSITASASRSPSSRFSLGSPTTAG